MSNKTRRDVLVNQMFRTWMKTLLHCGFGKTQVNQMTCEPMQPAGSKRLRVKEKTSFLFIGQHYRDITKS